MNLFCVRGEGFPVYQARADLREVPLFGLGKRVVQVFRDNKAEDRIAEEFKPLIRAVRLARTLEEGSVK
jgi:hypothetical protein